MSSDDFLFKTLIRAGYIPFGKGPDMDYEAVCFDLSARKKNSESPIVKIDHEEILCNSRIKVVSELAKTFEGLVLQSIERGAQLERDRRGVRIVASGVPRVSDIQPHGWPKLP
jgi:hypothetical protein